VSITVPSELAINGLSLLISVTEGDCAHPV
jgi:hypothetical protein